MHSLVEMDGVLPGDDVVKGGSGSSGLNITVSKARALILETATGRRASGVMSVRRQIGRRYPVLTSDTPSTTARLSLRCTPLYQYASALLPAFCHVELWIQC